MRYTNVWDKGGVKITATCPHGHETDVNDADVSASDSDCEICGSHGDIELSWVCAECETGYIYTLSSW